MKRGAEKQISKDDGGSDDEESPQVGFKKADDDILANRKIRGLPKRALGASASVTESASVDFTSPSLFGGSNPFGSNQSATNPFQLPVVSTAATSTAKTLSSLIATPSNPLSSSNLSFGVPAAPAVPLLSSTSRVQTTQKDSMADPMELKYYTSLRGLNESLRATIQKALDDDPFVDVGGLLERYKFLRGDIQKDFDARPTPTSTTSSAPLTKTFSMPVPPATGFKFGAALSSENKTPSTNASGGFTPSIPIPTGSWLKPAETKSTEPNPPSGLSFNAILKTDEKAAPSPAFSIPSKPSDDNKSNLPGPSLFSGFGKTPNPATDPFGVSKQNTFTYGTNTSAPFGVFGDKNSEKDKPSNPFALPSSSTATTPTSSFSLGTEMSTSSSQPSRFTGFTGFGKPPSSGSSVGFGFAAPLASSTKLASDTPSGEGYSADGGDDVPKKNTAESFMFNADNKHDQEGAGEEDEETVHAVKLKAYVMKDDKGAKNWVELGYGVLRIKKHKESGSRRILLRSSSTGQILINFAFHSAFKPGHRNKNITFLGHDAQNKSKMYTLKLQTEKQAADLKASLDTEIKGKDESES